MSITVIQDWNIYQKKKKARITPKQKQGLQLLEKLSEYETPTG